MVPTSPYTLLAATSKWIIHLLNLVRGRSALVLLFLFCVATSFVLSRFGSSYLYGHRCIYMLFCYVHLMFPFVLGVMAAKYGWMQSGEAQNRLVFPSSLWTLSLVGLMALQCIVNISVLHPFYVCLFIFIFLQIAKPRFVEQVLQRLGRCSMDMWFVHASVFLYLFPQRLFYDLNPIIYYCIAVFVSWFFAEVVNAVTRKIPI